MRPVDRGVGRRWHHSGVVAEAGAAPSAAGSRCDPRAPRMLLGYQVTDRRRRSPCSTGSVSPIGEAATTSIEVEVPGYRVDIDREVDLIEEVARMQGYDRIGSTVLSAGQAGGEPAGIPCSVGASGTPWSVQACGRFVCCRSPPRTISRSPGTRTPIAVANPLQADERVPAHAADCRDCSARWLANQARGSEAVAIFEIGIVFRLGRPCGGATRRSRSPCAAPRVKGGPANAGTFDVLDATGVLEALMAELAIAGLVAGRCRERPVPPGPFRRRPRGRASASAWWARSHPGIAADLELAGPRRGRRAGGACAPRRDDEGVRVP